MTKHCWFIMRNTTKKCLHWPLHMHLLVVFLIINHLKLISEQQTKIAHACTNTKEKLYRTKVAIPFNKVYLCALVGRIYHNNQNVFHVLTSVCAHNAMFCLQNDTIRILYAYHSDDPVLRPGTKFGTLLHHGPKQRGSRTLYLVERVNLEKPLPRDLLFWDLMNPVVSKAQRLLMFYHFR
jgi:hypothetical protein